ncbi:hypothetical protein ACE38V_03995 [Cytobacillus sp. Hz8]
MSPKQGFIWTGKGISKQLSPKQWTFGQFGRIQNSGVLTTSSMERV